MDWSARLIGPMLLGIGLGRTRLIPTWAAVAIVARTPLQIAGFLTHVGLTIEIASYGLLLAGSIPVATALTRRGQPPVAGRSTDSRTPIG